MKFKHLSLTLLVLISLTSCKNQFGYEKNDWVQVSSTAGDNPQVFYIDQNRTKCDGTKCMAWTKILFAKEQPITFQSSGDMATTLVKRIDSTKEFQCKKQSSTLISYQLYDKKDQLTFSNWPNKPIEEEVLPNTIDMTFFNKLCNQ